MSIFTLFLTPFLSPVQGVVTIRKQRVKISPHSVFPVPAAPLNYNPLLNPKGLYTSCPHPPKPPVTKLIEKGTHFLICKVKTGVETSFWQRDLSNQPQEAPPCGKQGGVERLWLKWGERPRARPTLFCAGF